MSEFFRLTDEELAIAQKKISAENKLGFAVLLKYFQLENRYPKGIQYIDPLMAHTIADQLNVPHTLIANYDWEGRSTKRFRQEIRDLLGFKEATRQDINKLKEWLLAEVFPNVIKRKYQLEQAYIYFRDRKIEPIAPNELERHIRSTHYEFEQDLYSLIFKNLPDNTKLLIDELLTDDSLDDDEDKQNEEITEFNEIKFRHLKKDIPGAKLKKRHFRRRKN